MTGNILLKCPHCSREMTLDPASVGLSRPVSAPAPTPAGPPPVWNGTGWVSSIVAPAQVQTPPIPGRIEGSFVPPTRVLQPHELPGTPAPRIMAQYQSPALPVAAQVPQLGIPYMGGQTIAPVVVQVQPGGGERPLTADEFAMVQASRAAPNGAITVMPPPAAVVVPEPPAVPLTPLEQQIAAAIAAAASGKL